MIKIKSISKSFGDIRAVDHVSLDIDAGEVFGLLGPNGAGKTTTVNMISGLFGPDDGEIIIMGQGSPLNPNIRMNIGTAPQSLALYDQLTGAENLEFFGKMYGLRGRELSRRVTESITFVDLNDRKNSRVKTYSGGMKRRLNLAAALIHEPRIIILDEPTAGVDPQSRNALFDNIETLKKNGRTVILTTHYMEEAERLCTRTGIMDHGKLLALDTVDNLIKSYGGHTVLIADCSDGEIRIQTNDPLSELNKLKETGQLRHYKIHSPDLETVFLNLTGRKLRD